jgi:FMN phosphatase YigB (HAD superfamily)
VGAVRAVVFDIGGVLEYTPALGVSRRWAKKLGVESSERLDGIWRAGSLGTIPLAEVHRAIGELLGWPPTRVDAVMSDIWTEYLGTLNVELLEFFRGLRPRYRTGILSNSFVGAREREQDHYGVDQWSDDLVYSHEVGMCKPDPRIYLLTCERLGVRPEETVFLDDVEANVVAAREVGMSAILFQDNAQAITDTKALLGAPEEPPATFP